MSGLKKILIAILIAMAMLLIGSLCRNVYEASIPTWQGNCELKGGTVENLTYKGYDAECCYVPIQEGEK